MLKIIGHRGARGLFPENTLFGFEKTLDFPVSGLELDVVISGDEEIVVSHEPWMNHLFCETPDKKVISKKDEQNFNLFSMNYSEIVLFDCGNKPHPKFPNKKNVPAQKPLLRDVFQLIDNYKKDNFILFIEIKSDPNWYGKFQPEPPKYANIINEFLNKNPVPFNVMIQSFDPYFLNEFAAINSETPLGLLVENHLTPQSNIQLLNFLPAFYNPHYSLVSKMLIDYTKNTNLELVPWTVNSIMEASRLKTLGVETIISDFPNLFL